MEHRSHVSPKMASKLWICVGRFKILRKTSSLCCIHHQFLPFGLSLLSFQSLKWSENRNSRNADAGTKIWRQDLGNVPFQSFDCDPFLANRVALLTSSGSVLLINDFSLTKPPSTTANQQFKMTNLHSDSTPVSTLEESKRGSLTEKFIRKPFMQVFGGGIEKLRFV